MTQRQRGGLKFSWTGKTRIGPKMPSFTSFINKGVKTGSALSNHPLLRALVKSQLKGKGHTKCKCHKGKGLDPKRRRGRQSN